MKTSGIILPEAARAAFQLGVQILRALGMRPNELEQCLTVSTATLKRYAPQRQLDPAKDPPIPPPGSRPAPTTAQGPPLPPRPARRRQPIAPMPAPPGGRPTRSRGQVAPRPGSAFTFVAPEAAQEEIDGGADHDQLAATSQAEDILPDAEEP